MKVIDNRSTGTARTDILDLTEGELYLALGGDMDGSFVIKTDEKSIVTLNETCTYAAGTLLSQSNVEASGVAAFTHMKNCELVIN